MKKRKTILHIIDSLGTGGAEVLLVNTVNSLPNYNHTVVTLGPKNDFINRFENVDIECINFTSKTKLFSSVLKLRKRIKKWNIEIVHAHLYWSTIIARLACLGLDVKFVFSLHTVMSVDSFSSNHVMLWLEKITYSSGQIVIGVSKVVLDDYDKIVGLRGESYILYNFIGDEFFSKSLVQRVDRINPIKIVAVGNASKAKNYIFLIEIFKRIDNSKFALDIYGEGPDLPLLKKMAEKLNLNINFKGHSNNLDLVLQKYNLYISSSVIEGFGIAPLEAMAMGLPTLLSNIQVFKEVAADGALYFDLKKKENLVEILRKIENGEIDLNMVSKKGKERAAAIAKKKFYIEKLSLIYSS